jgi:hypothetical protein
MNIKTKLATPGCFALTLLALAMPLPEVPKTGIPEGFTPLFDGKDIKGWHFSRTNHHGSTGTALVENGEIVLKQHPYGQGGLLITDKEYENFELYLEVKEAWGCNSGIFLRSAEGGSAYQVELDQAMGNANLLGELLPLSKGARATDIAKVWKTDDWNSFRVRMEGDSPHITLWVNGVRMWDVQEPANDKIAGETSGHIGLQLHWGSTYEPREAKGFSMSFAWKPDAEYRFRNVAIKELP